MPRKRSDVAPVCGTCGTTKVLRKRYEKSRSADAVRWWCPECQGAHKRKHAKRYERRKRLERYGITEADVDLLRRYQRGECWICQKDKPLCIDHSHEKGHVRGLLCGTCNSAIGLLGDDYEVIKRASLYVRLTALERIDTPRPFLEFLGRAFAANG